MVYLPRVRCICPDRPHCDHYVRVDEALAIIREDASSDEAREMAALLERFGFGEGDI